MLSFFAFGTISAYLQFLPRFVSKLGVLMTYALLIPLFAAFFVTSSFSQDRIYRCGNEYTNTVPNPQTRGCKLMEGGNVTVVKNTRPTTSVPVSSPARPAATATPSSTPSAQRVDASEQRARDSDARQILESELKKSEARQVDLRKAYNNGQPVKRGDEESNPAKYQERVTELKASLARTDSDIAGIRRELGRLPGNSAAK